jgi:CRISPR-associated endonuclease/helicase Cas3
MDCNKFYQLVGGWLSYGANPSDEADHQVKIWERLLAESSLGGSPLHLLTFLRASVGSGKTEAVLFPCLSTLRIAKSPKRLFLVYPTRSLVDDQIHRILGEDGYLQRFARITGQIVKANIDTGARSQFWKIGGSRRTCYEGRTRRVWENGTEHLREPLDFPYNPLYNADVILTTFDKFIFRFFGYGKRRWSYIFPFRIRPDLRPVTVCFDEAHLYDSVAFTNFRELVNALVSHGVQVVIMSATLSSFLIEQAFPYAQPLSEFLVDGFVKGGNRIIEWQKGSWDKSQFASRVKELLVEARPAEQKRIVVTNTVEQAYLVYSELQEMDNLFFYHGRQLTDSRTKTYHQLRQRDKENQPYTLVTTHAIEVGCDLSADLLITEICNPDQLIQRIGRCARKSGEGRVIIVGDKVPAWMRDDMVDETEYLEKKLASFTTYGKSSVESLTSVIQGAPWMDVRIEMLFGALYDFVYEGDLSHLPLYKNGFVITRSWIPSATVYFVDAEDLEKVNWRDWHNAPSLSVSLEYLSTYKPPNKDLTEVQQAQVEEDQAFTESEKSKPPEKRKALPVPFRTNAEDPTVATKLKPTDFRVYISLEKDQDYEDNWIEWQEYRAESAVSAYEHELAIVLRRSDFPNINDKGLVEKLKLFEREYQSRRQRVQITFKTEKGERRLWYLKGE